MQMSKQAFGLSLLSGDKQGLILQAPTERSKGNLFVLKDEKAWRLELAESIVNNHRSLVGIPEHVAKGEAPVSSNIANYNFVNEVLKNSVNSGSYTIDFNDEGPAVRLKYLFTGVEYTGTLQGFITTSMIDVIKATIVELNRVYNDVEGLLKDAADQGLTLELKSEKIDPLKAQRIKEMSMMRKHVSAANPLVRAKKIQKGFGSK